MKKLRIYRQNRDLKESSLRIYLWGKLGIRSVEEWNYFRNEILYQSKLQSSILKFLKEIEK